MVNTDEIQEESRSLVRRQGACTTTTRIMVQWWKYMRDDAPWASRIAHSWPPNQHSLDLQLTETQSPGPLGSRPGGAEPPSLLLPRRQGERPPRVLCLRTQLPGTRIRAVNPRTRERLGTNKGPCYTAATRKIYLRPSDISSSNREPSPSSQFSQGRGTF